MLGPKPNCTYSTYIVKYTVAAHIAVVRTVSAITPSSYITN